MSYHTVIDADTLAAHWHDPAWVVVDCRFNLLDTEAGRRAYHAGHIPSARYAHLDEDLSGPVTPVSGRHPLPAPIHLAATLSQWGIHAQTQVVAYDEAGGGIAARLWWLLRWLGHSRCALLDGGLPAWQRRGLPLSTEVPERQPALFLERHDDSLWVNSAAVLDQVLHGEALVLDVRAAVRYRGEREPLDPVAGHIPGAVNLPLEQTLNEGGGLLKPAELRARFSAVLKGRSPAQVMVMCGSGVTACHSLLALEVAGLPGARLYAGSWSEWIRDPARPVARGTD